MFIELDNKVDFSKGDISRNIKLPNKLTPELAELMGIIVGDGHIYYGEQYEQTTMYCISISGNLSEDYDYYKESINNIFYKIFNLKFSFSSQKQNELIVRIYSKAIAGFFKNLGIKSGNKTSKNYIPQRILISNDNVKKGFLKGIFDIEFSITFKRDIHGKNSRPLLSTKIKSYQLVSQLNELLKYFGFSVYVHKEKYLDKRYNKLNVGYRIELTGKKNLKKYLELIGFRNPKHLTKMKIWTKFGFCPPKVPYSERIRILKGELNPNSFYNPI